jgi:hypothetical protein
MNSVGDQMKILDPIGSGSKVTVIDVRAGLLSPTLRALNEIGFLDGVKRGQFSLGVFHILGPSIASLEEIAETSRFLTDARYFLVKNFINNTTFFDWDPATYNSYFNRIKNAEEIAVPKLNELACEQVELAGAPFLAFASNRKASGEATNNSFVLRGYVRHWLGTVWAEYARVRLNELVSQPETALRQAG